MKTESNATQPTDPAFTKGAAAGKVGEVQHANYPLERRENMGTTKMPAYGAKKYKEYGAPSPSIAESTTQREET